MSAPERFMNRALGLAKKAKALGEVPVGAVIVRDGKVIATGYNKRESGKNALLHAEMIALSRACKKVGDWRLSDCDLYVTLEPCPMCAGAIINARIHRVYVGAPDPKGGCMGSLCDLTKLPFNHHPEVISGVLEEPCAALISEFFRDLRNTSVPEKETVLLRSFTEADTDRLKQYCYPQKSKDQIREMIREWNTRFYDGKYCEFFAVTVKDEPVGFVSLMEQSPQCVSVGAQIFPGYRGKTYGTQAVTEVCRRAALLGYPSVSARVRKNNTPSNRLCRRVGFSLTGEDVTERGVEVFTYLKNLE